MVKSSRSSRGLKDWIWQRVSAVLLSVYLVFILRYFMLHPDLNYNQWHLLVKAMWFKVATVIMFISLIIHAWVGLWTIFTDYLHNTQVRWVLQCLVIIGFIVYLLWTVLILWG